MAARKNAMMRRSVLGILAPLALTVAGTVLLLNTLGALPWDIWDHVARWWPASLIVLGLGVLAKNLRT
jgi:hypothetical protein